MLYDASVTAAYNGTCVNSLQICYRMNLSFRTLTPLHIQMCKGWPNADLFRWNVRPNIAKYFLLVRFNCIIVVLSLSQM